MSESAQDAPFSVRLPADLVAELRRAAEEQDRTLSAEIRQALRQYVASLKKKAAVLPG
jgi:predicted transcriptional regulator